MLGRPLGEPFYRSFLESVRDFSIDEQLIDRVLHYMQTYGCNDHENRHWRLMPPKALMYISLRKRQH